MTPRILDLPSPLPLMHSLHDAARLDAQEHTTFYTTAFLLQCWISELTLFNSAEIAEKPNPNQRSFQTGNAWRGFVKCFGKRSNAKFPTIFGHLMQFGQYQDPFASRVHEAAFPLSVEHELTHEFLGRHSPSALRYNPNKLIDLMRRTTTRLCDWLDSALHFRVLLEWHIMPDCFDPDPQKRELAYLAINQRYFDSLSQRAQAHWLNHLSDLVEELPNSPKWAAFHQTASAPIPERRPWPTQNIDLTIVKLWPLVKHHHWSAGDLRFVLQRVLSEADFAPFSDETVLVAHTNHVLGLRYVGLQPGRHGHSEPAAYKVALRLCTQQSGND
jgi:hypothetical protein